MNLMNCTYYKRPNIKHDVTNALQIENSKQETNNKEFKTKTDEKASLSQILLISMQINQFCNPNKK